MILSTVFFHSMLTSSPVLRLLLAISIHQVSGSLGVIAHCILLALSTRNPVNIAESMGLLVLSLCLRGARQVVISLALKAFDLVLRNVKLADCRLSLTLEILCRRLDILNLLDRFLLLLVGTFDLVVCLLKLLGSGIVVSLCFGGLGQVAISLRFDAFHLSFCGIQLADCRFPSVSEIGCCLIGSL